jgi:hypothetical protein
VAVDGLSLEVRRGAEGRVDVEGLALRLGRYWYDMAGARA